MILDEGQILKYILEPYQEHLDQFKEEHQLLDMLCNGGDVGYELEKIQNYENDAQKKLRERLARSTKDLLLYLKKPQDKVFSAEGFVNTIELKVSSASEDVNKYLNELPEGISIRKWMQDCWLEAYNTDPNALLFIEKETEEQARDREPLAYPTIKSVSVLHDFQNNWNRFEYVIFLHKQVKMDWTEKLVQVYRVFDEEKDALYYVKEDAGESKLMPYDSEEEAHLMFHGLNEIPAFFISDRKDKKTGGRLSFLDGIKEVLREFLNDQSVHTITKYIHAFPIFWRLAMKCGTCDGTGVIAKSDGSTEKKTCPTCNGKRYKTKTDVSDGVVLPMPKGNQTPLNGDQIAGYIEKDLDTIQMQLDIMDRLKKQMFYSLWGTYMDIDPEQSQKTATQAVLDVKPMSDVLEVISSQAEQVESKLVTSALIQSFPTAVDSFQVKYGRKYTLETPETLWKKYVDAKSNGASISDLDALHDAYLMAEYHNDQESLRVKKLQFQLEPLPHYTASQMSGVFPQAEIQKKMLFSEWFLTVEDFDKEIEVLKQEFETWVSDKITVENEEVTGS